MLPERASGRVHERTSARRPEQKQAAPDRVRGEKVFGEVVFASPRRQSMTGIRWTWHTLALDR